MIGVNLQRIIGCDVGFGPSAFGIAVLQHVDGKIRVIHNQEYQRASFSDLVEDIWHLKQRLGQVANLYVDGSSPEFIDALNMQFGQNSSWSYIHDQIAKCKKHNRNIEDYLFVVPVNFQQDGARILQHVIHILDDDYDLLQIHPKFNKLLTALRTAVSSDTYKLDKDATSYSDTLDAFRMALSAFRYARS